MPYPKPLSEKSLEKLYTASSLTDEIRSFLHAFFAACANLYGTIDMRNAWAVCQQIKDRPRVRRKDLLAFSAIVRREEQPYYIYEVDELYADARNDMDRQLIAKELVTYGQNRLWQFYELSEMTAGREYWVPDDLLSYASPVPTPEITALRSFLADLKSTAKECVPKHGRPIENANIGKKLSQFSFLNDFERFESEWLSKHPNVLADFLADCAGPESEKIMRQYLHMDKTGGDDPNRPFEFLMEELSEVGVELTEKQLNQLLNLVMACHNSNHLWCLAGWSPQDLARRSRPGGPTAISFGPGLQKAFADGTMDKDELVKGLREMGLDVVD